MKFICVMFVIVGSVKHNTTNQPERQQRKLVETIPILSRNWGTSKMLTIQNIKTKQS